MDDTMSGLFETQREAYLAGKAAGCDEFYRYALQRMSELSVEYEKSGDVDAFRAAEMACGTLRSAKVIADKHAALIKGN